MRKRRRKIIGGLLRWGVAIAATMAFAVAEIVVLEDEGSRLIVEYIVVAGFALWISDKMEKSIKKPHAVRQHYKALPGGAEAPTMGANKNIQINYNRKKGF